MTQKQKYMFLDQDKTREIITSAIEKAWNDDAFRVMLLNDPIAAISKMTGTIYDFPKDSRIIFLDQQDHVPKNTNSIIYININQTVDLDDLELDEQQLEAIAGGQRLLSFLVPANIPMLQTRE